MTNEVERRCLPSSELRMQSDEKPIITGHAALFNTLSEDLGGFREQIRPGAFAESLKRDDVRALFNHDPNCLLGRSRAGTLRLWEDERGLGIEIDPPDTQLGRDLTTSISRGDLSQMSFGFVVEEDGQAWERDKRGAVTRTLTSLRLFDVSPVVFPAYAQTAVAVRALNQWQSGSETKAQLPLEQPLSLLRRKLILSLVQ